MNRARADDSHIDDAHRLSATSAKATSTPANGAPKATGTATMHVSGGSLCSGGEFAAYGPKGVYTTLHPNDRPIQSRALPETLPLTGGCIAQVSSGRCSDLNLHFAVACDASSCDRRMDEHGERRPIIEASAHWKAPRSPRPLLAVERPCATREDATT